MSSFWTWWLGLDPKIDWSSGRVSVEFQSVPEGAWAAAAIALGLAALLGVWLLYKWEGRQLSIPVRATLATIRLAILALVTFMLLDMALVVTTTEFVKSRLLVLLDTSQSMGLTDPFVDERIAKQTAEAVVMKNEANQPDVAKLRNTPRLALAQRAFDAVSEDLGRDRELHLYEFSGVLKNIEDASFEKVRAEGTATGVGDALKTALADHKGQPLAGVLLITDGRSNSGEDAGKAAIEVGKAGVKVASLAVGTTQGPRNARVAELEVNPVVFVRDPIEIAVITESRGLQGSTASVILEQRQDDGSWKEIAREEVTLGEDAALKRTVFPYTPDTIGLTEFRARVDDVGPELTLTDNLASKPMRVVRQGIRVLMIAGYPSPEMQFMRNALLRDTALEFGSWLQNAGEGYEHVGHRPLRRLPNEQKELDRYDVLILFDPNMRQLGSKWPEMITKFVGEAGGGLVFVAGEINSKTLFSPESSAVSTGGGADNSWLKTLPVVVDPNLYQSSADVRLSSRESYYLELTPEGNSDKIFRFAPEEAKNREVVASLPGMYWHFPVTRAKPGATVLARHGDPRMKNNFGRHVLMASQLYGPGRSVFLGFDSTYRWRYLHEEYFDGFWARLIDRVGRNKVLGGRYPFTLATDKAVYRVGDRVKVRAELVDSTEATAGLGELKAELEWGTEASVPLALDPLPEDPRVMEATHVATEAGPYTLRVTPSMMVDLEGGLRPATLNFKVEPPRVELDNPTLDRAILEQIASVTEGKVFTLLDADRIPSAFDTRLVERVHSQRDEFWDAPVIVGAIILLITIEWVLRKKFRMA